jgi:hypothetical protein
VATLLLHVDVDVEKQTSSFVVHGSSSYASPGSLCGSMLRAWVPVRSEMQCRGEEGNYSD